MSNFKKLMAEKNKSSASEAIKNVEDNRDYSVVNNEVISIQNDDDINNDSDVMTKSKEYNNNQLDSSEKEVKVHIEKSKYIPAPEEQDNDNTFMYTTNYSLPLKEQCLNMRITGARKPVMLLHDLNRFMRIRSKQLGVNMDIYCNVILQEERERVKTEDTNERSLLLYEACDKKYKGAKERSSISFTDDNYAFIAEESNNAGISYTDYLNYLMDKEMKRELVDGKRI